MVSGRGFGWNNMTGDIIVTFGMKFPGHGT